MPTTADAAYFRRHYRVKAARGQARHYRCACGRQAAQWSQTHGTTGEDPADYIPRCVQCHVYYDRPELGPMLTRQPDSAQIAKAIGDLASRFRCTGPCDFCWPPPGVKQPELMIGPWCDGTTS